MNSEKLKSTAIATVLGVMIGRILAKVGEPSITETQRDDLAVSAIQKNARQEA